MIRVKNFGQTPAYNLLVNWGTGSGPWPLTNYDGLTIQPTKESVQIAPPGALTYWAIGKTGGGAVTAEEFADFRNGAKRFYIFGEITYKDAFQKDRYTNFCLAVVPPNDVGSPDFGLQRCERHNDAN